ncbi:NAD-dependent epimerase/dehydratase family protein [Ferruginibacter profundus]
MRERVLITGASGFLGFHLIEAALAAGLDVYAAVRKNSDVKHLQHFNIKYTYPDFSSITNMKAEIENKQYQYIIHAAGITRADNKEKYNQVNAELTYKLGKAAAMADTGLKKFVFVSSLAAVGPLQHTGGILTEHSIPGPVTSYGKSKLLAEQKLGDLVLPLTIIRPTAIYGPREKDIFLLFKAISRGWEPYIGKQAQQLSFVYVKDVADVTVKALMSNYHNKVYHISDGDIHNRYELAERIKFLLHKKTKQVHLPQWAVKLLAGVLEITYGAFNRVPALNSEKLRELTAVNWNCSIEKAYLELGFEPVYDLNRGLAETVDWYKKNKWI